MFESAEIGHALAKTEYRKIEPKLRADLLEAQFALSKDGRFPVVILISGVRGAGKGETVNLLNEWMDPRFIHTHAFDNPSDEEAERPPMWRYWRVLPPRGRIGMLFGSWYTAPIIDRVFKRTGAGDLAQSIEEIRGFERMLTDEGALLLKFWFHLGKSQQRKRLKALESDPKTRWRVTGRDWDFFKHYDRFYQISESTLRATSTGYTPWTVIEGGDPQYRSVMAGRTLLAALRGRLAQKAAEKPKSPNRAPEVRALDNLHILSKLDLEVRIDKEKYDTELAKWQGELARLTRHPGFAQRNVVLVFEGMDAAGKGGAIRRVTAALDARLYHTIPIAAPTDEERAQPYLWRFWRHVPRKGRFTIYDRSWYGRVLVERIEGFCGEADWRRAYAEINEFEAQLTRSGAIVAKFWLQISKDEQYRRFKERERIRFKQFKITPEDWRNRSRWDAYQTAAADMVERTSTADSPWVLVESNDKHWARVKIVKTLCRQIKARLG
ncbi:MAG TPA: polyphosphate:AMP phosphotransferase [Burkholderiales bacterium]|nr:polyphosphate:AMP phosphotransferase [Burkholderiales bacterium]